MTGPTLHTERLELRWLSVDDAPMMLAVWNDPAFVRFVGDRGVRSLEEAEVAMRDGLLRLYDEHNYGPFVVIRREDGQETIRLIAFGDEEPVDWNIAMRVNERQCELPPYLRQGILCPMIAVDNRIAGEQHLDRTSRETGTELRTAYSLAGR